VRLSSGRFLIIISLLSRIRPLLILFDYILARQRHMVMLRRKKAKRERRLTLIGKEGRKITHHSSRLGLIGWTGSIRIIKTIHHKLCNTNNVQLPNELLHGHNVCTKQSRISVPLGQPAAPSRFSAAGSQEAAGHVADHNSMRSHSPRAHLHYY
jgi:hypothetical protein